MFVSYHPHHKKKKKVTWVAGRTFFFTLFKLNINFYFKCYSHHNCNINLKWNNTQLYSSTKPLGNVLSPVFWFVNFCFFPFLRRTSIQKWKKNWLCCVHKLIGKKEISAKISESLCRNLFIYIYIYIYITNQTRWYAAQIRAVYKDHKILATLKRCITCL